jgi:hypothetical protein
MVASLCHREAGRSMRVIDAGQQADAGQARSARVAVAAALCCCTLLLHVAPGVGLVEIACDTEASLCGLSVGGRWVMSTTTHVFAASGMLVRPTRPGR